MMTVYRSTQAEFKASSRASKVMGCTLSVLRLTSTRTPLLENLGMQINLTCCPSFPAQDK